MVAQYKETFFNIALNENPHRIWRYNYSDGLDKRIHKSGLAVYERLVDLTELDALFEPVFTVKWNGAWFGCQYLPISKEVRLFTDSAKLIEKFGFNQFEYGVWDLYVDIDTCEDFQVRLKDYYTKEFKALNPSKTEWQDLWNKLVVDLIPKR